MNQISSPVILQVNLRYITKLLFPEETKSGD